tara:strand:- start:180 stop:878 length:699 start_codon:yes stop_codon:yes gene_type:complete
MKSRKGQLVCQHLENISRKALVNYQKIIKEYVKGRHGVYALYRKGNLYYVGLASNLRNRLKTHLRDHHGNTWDTFSVYLVIKDAHLRELETLILKIASPKGNKQSGKFVKAQNLKPLFKKKISKAQQKELEDLLGLAKDKGVKRKEIKRVKGRKPILAPYVSKRFRLRFRYKGKMHKATVRKDGTIFYNKKLYNSPSLAARAVMKHTANGWLTWQYERAPGDWVKLKELRKK